MTEAFELGDSALVAGLNPGYCSDTTAPTQYVNLVSLVIVPPLVAIVGQLSGDSRLGAAASGMVILVPRLDTVGGAIRVIGWECGGTPTKYLPAPCRQDLSALLGGP